jgi:hypothetical protein
MNSEATKHLPTPHEFIRNADESFQNYRKSSTAFMATIIGLSTAALSGFGPTKEIPAHWNLIWMLPVLTALT